MRARAALLAGGIVLLIAIIAGPLYLAINEDQLPDQDTAPLDAASASSAHFLDRYVDPDGRVVRRDQGGDTVSEGQAYAMLVAVATGDQARFDSAWTWAKNNLIQSNGLMAWNWKDGAIVDPQPASDADLDAARALVVASRQFNNAAYAEEAKVLAAAIMQYEVIDTANGIPVLLAGPWAVTEPFYTNPSYHSPRTFDELATLTGNQRWNALAQAERNRTAVLLQPEGEPVQLPSDWATVTNDGTVSVASPPGDSSIAPRYSYDALRLPVRLAESCNTEDLSQGRVIFGLLNRSVDTRTSAVIALDGDVIDTNKTAVGAVATAGGAKAAQDQNQVLTLLTQADQYETDNSTYYGAAWAALGRIMLTTSWLGNCN